MEALIVIAAALIVVVLLEAGYCIALCLMGWAPSLLVGLIVSGIAHRNGVGAHAVAALFALTTLAAKRVLPLASVPPPDNL